MYKPQLFKTLMTALMLSIPFYCLQAQGRDIKIPNTLPMENPINQALQVFADEVSAKTNGELTFTIIPNGVLGGEQALIQQCLGGMLETVAVGGVDAFQQQLPEMGIDNLPFMFKTPEDSWKAYDGAFGEELNKKVEKLGLKKITYLVQGFRQITNNKHEVKTPDDLKGLKIRVPVVEIRMKAFKALGANPIPLPLPELFTALQQGAVDAQENPLITIMGMKLNEVQKYITISNHIYNTGILYFNSSFFDSLTPEYQKIIMEAGEKAKEYGRKVSLNMDDECLKKLKADGNIITTLTDEEHQLFVDAVKPLWDEYVQTYGDSILKLVDSNN